VCTFRCSLCWKICFAKSDISYVLWKKFMPKKKLFTTHFLIFFTEDKKISIFHEICRAHIECQLRHESYRVFLYILDYFFQWQEHMHPRLKVNFGSKSYLLLTFRMFNPLYFQPLFCSYMQPIKSVHMAVVHNFTYLAHIVNYFPSLDTQVYICIYIYWSFAISLSYTLFISPSPMCT
jgi:hypothetical protein